MHFELLAVDLDAREILDARVGDVGIFERARFAVSDLTREDLKWAHAQLAAIGAAFGVTEGGYVLESSLDNERVEYRFTARGADGALSPERPLADLDDAARADVEQRVDALLEAVHALLVIP